MENEYGHRIYMRKISKAFNNYRMFVNKLQEDVQGKNEAKRDFALYISDKIFKHATSLVEDIHQGEDK